MVLCVTALRLLGNQGCIGAPQNFITQVIAFPPILGLVLAKRWRRNCTGTSEWFHITCDYIKPCPLLLMIILKYRIQLFVIYVCKRMKF